MFCVFHFLLVLFSSTLLQSTLLINSIQVQTLYFLPLCSIPFCYFFCSVPLYCDLFCFLYFIVLRCSFLDCLVQFDCVLQNYIILFYSTLLIYSILDQKLYHFLLFLFSSIMFCWIISLCSILLQSTLLIFYSGPEIIFSSSLFYSI